MTLIRMYDLYKQYLVLANCDMFAGIAVMCTLIPGAIVCDLYTLYLLLE